MDALAELVESPPEGVVATDPTTLENYRHDWSRDTGAGTPVAVVRAGSAGALLIVQSDTHGDSRVAEIAAVEAACEAGAVEIVVDRRPGRGRDVRRRARCRVPGRGGPRRPAAGRRRCAGAAAPRPARGDGNTHPIIVHTEGDADSERRARAVFDDILAAAIRLGGMITGEHGVGRTKKAALPDQLGADVMALTRRVKDALDPDGILNPGAVL